MSYNTAKRYNPKEPFSGGMVDNTPDVFMGDNYSPYLRDCRLDGHGIITRKGHSYLTTMTGGTTIKGLAYYNDGLIVANNSKFYFVDTSTGGITEIIGKSIIGVNTYTTTLATWNAITDGEFRLNTTNITGMNFSTATDLDDVWAIIKAAIDTATSQTNTIVRVEGDKLVINCTETIIISVPGGTGTDIRATMGVATYNSGDIYSTSYKYADDHRIGFVEAGKDLLICAGPTNAGNTNITLRKLMGLSIVECRYSGSVPSGLQPTFGVVFNGSAWISGDANTGDTVYKSVGDTFDDFRNTGSDSFKFNEDITGLATTGKSLFYFTKNTISETTNVDIQDLGGSVYYSNSPLTVREGAVNNASIVVSSTKVYYLTPSNKIMKLQRGYQLDGFDDLELSHRKYKGINTYMEGLKADQTDSSGYFLPKYNLIKWFVKTSSASTNDNALVYDTEHDTFLVDTNSNFYEGVANEQEFYTIWSTTGKYIYKDEYLYVDEGDGGILINIQPEYWTKEFYYNDPSLKKIRWEARILMDVVYYYLGGIGPTPTIFIFTQKIYVDGTLYDTKLIPGPGEAIEATEDMLILRTKGDMNVIGKKIQFRFTGDFRNCTMRLKNIMLKVEQKPAISNNLTN